MFKRVNWRRSEAEASHLVEVLMVPGIAPDRAGVVEVLTLATSSS